MRAAGWQSTRQPLDSRSVHGFLARAVCTHGLSQKQGQRFCWRKQSFSVLGEQRLHGIEQVRACQQVEKAVGIKALGMMADTLLLMTGGSGSRMHGRLALVLS